MDNGLNINLIFAMDNKGGIGKDNQLLIKCKEDMKFFKDTTTNNIVIMGYNTFLSMSYKALPNRLNFVITNTYINCDNVITVKHISDAFHIINCINYIDKSFLINHSIFIIGGAYVYNYCLDNYPNSIDNVYSTEYNDDYNADIFINKKHIDSNFYKKNKIKIKDLSYNLGSIYVYKN